MKKFFITIILTLLSAKVFSASSCEGGKIYDANLNRCIISTTTVKNKTNAIKCGELTGDAYKNCLESNVKSSVSELESKNKIKGASNPKKNLFMPGIIALGGAYIIFTQKESLKTCGSTSVYMMVGAGVATLLGEVMAQSKYKKKLKNIKNDFQERLKERSNKDTDNLDIITQNQIAAFDFQIEQERARQKAHKSRKGTYSMAFGLYSAAVIAAIYEQMTLVGGSKPCKPSLAASAPPSGGGFLAKKLTPLSGLFKGPIKKGFQTPWVRAALAGVLAMHSKKVASKAKKLAKEAQDRVAAIEKLKEDFLGTGGAGFSNCSAGDRNKPSKPACYCYGPDGSQNQARTSSPTCQAAWKSFASLTPGQYGVDLNPNNFDDHKGCLNNNGSFNDSCNCSGNQCAQISGSLKLGPLSTLSGMKSLLKDNKALVDGKLSTGSIQDGAIGNMVAKMNKKKEDLAKKPKTAKLLKRVDELQNKLDKGLQAKVINAVNSNRLSPSVGGFGGRSSSAPIVSSKEDVLDEAKKSLGRTFSKIKC